MMIWSKYQNIDEASAFYWAKKAAKLNYPLGEYIVALAYFSGEGTPQNYVKSFYWFKKSANNRLASAEYIMGRIYAAGSKRMGVSKNKSKAQYWFKKAAKKGITGKNAKITTALLLSVKHFKKHFTRFIITHPFYVLLVMEH